MPRNIEYNLERYIDDNNLPNFILTCAMWNRFYPSSEILEQYGSAYGPDNWIFTHEELLNEKIAKQNELNKLLNSNGIDFIDINDEIEKKFNFENAEYQRWLTYYEEEVEKLNSMNKRVKILNPKNEKQVRFLKCIGDYFIVRKKEIDEQYKKRLNKPIKETFEQAKNRLVFEKIKDLQQSIERLELILLFDDSFFMEITKEWLN